MKHLSRFLLIITFLSANAPSFGMYTTGRQLLRPRTTARQRSVLQRYTTKPQTLPTSQHTVWQRAQETIRNNIPAFIYRWLGWQQPAPIALEKRTPITTEISKQLVISQTDLEKPIEELKPLFAQFNSLQQIANNLTSLETEAQQQLLTVAKMPEVLRNNLTQQEKALTNYLKTQIFKQSLEETTRDPMLPIELVNDVQKILQLAGLNPNCVSLGYNTNAEEDIFHHDAYNIEGFTLIKDGSGAITSVKPAAIWFNKEVIESLSPEVLYQKLIHAVTHIAESHLEKIQLLQSALGKAQFDMLMNTPEARIYHAAMERNANLMLATHIQAIKGKARDGILNILLNDRAAKQLIQKNPSVLGPLYEHGIQCDLDFLDASFFADIAEFAFLEKILKSRELLLRHAFKKFVSDNVYEQLLLYEKEEVDYINQHCYLMPNPGVVHDKNLGPLLEHAKMLLRNAGINPDSISIGFCEHGDAYAQAPILKRTIKKIDNSLIISSPQGFEPAKLLFGKQFFESIKNNPMANNPIVDWVTGHELAHLRLHHISIINAMLFCLSTLEHLSRQDNAWRFTFKNLGYINNQTEKERALRSKEAINLQKEHEMQADLFALLQNKKLAQQIFAALATVAGTPEGTIRPQELYRSPYELSLWLKAILRCWEKENKAIRIPMQNE